MMKIVGIISLYLKIPLLDRKQKGSCVTSIHIIISYIVIVEQLKLKSITLQIVRPSSRSGAWGQAKPKSLPHSGILGFSSKKV